MHKTKLMLGSALAFLGALTGTQLVNPTKAEATTIICHQTHPSKTTRVYCSQGLGEGGRRMRARQYCNVGGRIYTQYGTTVAYNYQVSQTPVCNGIQYGMTHDVWVVT